MRPPRTIISSLRGSLILQSRSPPRAAATRISNFSTSHPSNLENRIYDNVRNPGDLQTLLLLSSSSRQPLITLWSASWAPLSISTATLLTDLISSENVGQNAAAVAGGTSTSVGFAEVEADAPDMIAEDIAGRYMVNSVPMLLAFSRGEAQVETRITDASLLKDRQYLIEWIEKEAARGGQGGAGGSLFGGWFKAWGGGSS